MSPQDNLAQRLSGVSGQPLPHTSPQEMALQAELADLAEQERQEQEQLGQQGQTATPPQSFAVPGVITPVVAAETVAPDETTPVTEESDNGEGLDDDPSYERGENDSTDNDEGTEMEEGFDTVEDDEDDTEEFDTGAGIDDEDEEEEERKPVKKAPRYVVGPAKRKPRRSPDSEVGTLLD